MIYNFEQKLYYFISGGTGSGLGQPQESGNWNGNQL